MIHPNDVLRCDPRRSQIVFEAPRHIHIEEDITCGLSWLQLADDRLQRFAKVSYFIAVVAITGILQGALKSYFSNTSNIWEYQFGIPHEIKDWLLLSDNICQGLFALLVTFWAVKFHRSSWFGVLVIFQSVVVFLFIAPELEHPYTGIHSVQEDDKFLCHRKIFNATEKSDPEICWTSLGILFVGQIIFSLANLSYITLGLTYVDDNISEYNSPAFIGLAISSKIIGEQIGSYTAWTSKYYWHDQIFLSPAWLIKGSLLFICGVLITLFPKVLPSAALKYAVESILDEASFSRNNRRPNNVNEEMQVQNDENNSNDDAIRTLQNTDDDNNQVATVIEEEINKNGFFVTMYRLLRNGKLILNISIAVVAITAWFNFEYYSGHYIQARFHVGMMIDPSGYNDPALAQITSHLLKPILTSLAIFAAGIIIVKYEPNPILLMMINATLFFLITVMYSCFAFLNCQKGDPQGFGKPFCSYDCNCKDYGIPFSPVCMNTGETYFTPCQAGCHQVDFLNGVKMYNCSCSFGPNTKLFNQAFEGMCDEDGDCLYYWTIAEILSILIAALLGFCAVSHVFFTIRAVRPSDKALALALELTQIGWIPYCLSHLLYRGISEDACRYRGENGECLFQDKSFGTTLTFSTVGFMTLGLVMSMILAFWSYEVNLYEEYREPVEIQYNNAEEFEMVPMNNAPPPTPQPSTTRYAAMRPYTPLPTYNDLYNTDHFVNPSGRYLNKRQNTYLSSCDSSSSDTVDSQPRTH